jgi:hypothetical protein
MKKRAFISYFLLVIFALIYSHQLIPHHEHQHDSHKEVNNTSCGHHEELVCHTNETVSFSHLLGHLFDGDFHIEFSCSDILYKNLKVSKPFKTFYSKLEIQFTEQTNLISKSIDYLNFQRLDDFQLNAFSHRGPPQFV